MAGALAGIASKNGVIIDNWQSVSKSYPTFFDDLEYTNRRAK
jgi:5-enolpyruvylshikimate-3-phosphate synthase